ncbi:MAG: hypothetical protein PHP45_05415 [Elusimicrobiales bacterium]|nr:hypothetical protein [Elusimicrobiales bacterium]
MPESPRQLFSNWRKPLIYGLLHAAGGGVPARLREITRAAAMPQDELRRYQQDRLEKIILHAYSSVPYYRRLLAEYEVVRDGAVRPEFLDRLPLLTKQLIRQAGDKLLSADYKTRKPYFNTSGGSTGEPVRLVQDKAYNDANIADKIFFNRMLGKEPGDREIKLWGSERDIISGTIGLRERLINSLYNRRLLNTFRMTPARMDAYLREMAAFKPHTIWTYTDSMIELARHAAASGAEIFSPRQIIATTAVLTEEKRRFIGDIFRAPVHNQYGSREAGPIACECACHEGLHVFDWTHYVELVNGRVVVTVLTNYSMPLIRYDIGDTAEWQPGLCRCGLATRRLARITGRISGHFRLRDGTLIHGEYFTHIFYFRPWLKSFRIVQKDYDMVICRLAVSSQPPESELAEIDRRIKLVMGENCKIEHLFCADIPPSPSGKYIYTKSELA